MMMEIKKLREAQQLSQSRVAELLGLSRRAYVLKEKRLVAFTIEQARTLSRFFHIDFEEINWNVKKDNTNDKK